MDNRDELPQRIKALIVDNLMLQITAAEITDDQPLFGPEGIGLDSVDALQLVVALEKNFGLKIRDQSQAKEILSSVAAIAKAVEAHQTAAQG